MKICARNKTLKALYYGSLQQPQTADSHRESIPMIRLCLTNHFQGGQGRLTTLILIVILLVTTTGWAQKNSKLKPAAGTTPSAPADFRSKNFLVHTDLPSEDAKELLNRMETMLRLISRYWGRPNRQVIECYVVKDLKNWPSGVLHPRGLQSIREGAGITLSAKISRGNAFAGTRPSK